MACLLYTKRAFNYNFTKKTFFYYQTIALTKQIVYLCNDLKLKMKISNTYIILITVVLLLVKDQK